MKAETRLRRDKVKRQPISAVMGKRFEKELLDIAIIYKPYDDRFWGTETLNLFH